MKIILVKNAYLVLKSDNNPDFPNDDRAITKTLVPVDNSEQASNIVKEFIDDNNLGGGNWTGGKIFYDGENIGRVSYNGRVWDINNDPLVFSKDF